MTNREIAQEISNRIGTAPVPFDSVYSIALEIYHQLGGEESQFDSVYSILLEILPLVEGGGSGKAIEEVDALPEASENKEKFFRLSSDDNVYVSELKSRTTITTNRLPDEQQIDKAYLDEEGEDYKLCYYYKGVYKIICSDGELDGYGWYKYNEGIWYMYVTEDNAVNLNHDTITYTPNNEEIPEIELDTVNKVITISEYTVDNFKQSYGYTFSDLGFIPVTAIYNAPEVNQIGNAFLNSPATIYTGEEYTFTYNGVIYNGYKWGNYFASSKPASEIYFKAPETQQDFVISDTIFYSIEDEELTNPHTLYIPQLNAPDSEQVDNAYIEEDGGYTYYYTGNQVTLTASNGVFTCYLWENVEENVFLLTNTNATNTFGNTIYYQAENGDIVKIDNTHYESQSGGLDNVETYTLMENNFTISTVKYQRTETIEEWDWQPLTDNATNDDIDAMFESSSPVVKRVLMKLGSYINEDDEENPSPSSERYPLSILEGLVNENDETMEYDGDTYYKWIKYEDRGNGTSTPDEVGDENVIVLTTSLNPTLPFSSSSPEWVYMIGSESEEAVYASPSTETYPKEALIHENGSITYEE